MKSLPARRPDNQHLPRSSIRDLHETNRAIFTPSTTPKHDSNRNLYAVADKWIATSEFVAMRGWHHDRKVDIGLRLCGVASCGLSYLAIHSLMTLRLADGQLPQGALTFFLAAFGFLCASGGAMLLSVGHHIFDQIEISKR